MASLQVGDLGAAYGHRRAEALRQRISIELRWRRRIPPRDCPRARSTTRRGRPRAASWSRPWNSEADFDRFVSEKLMGGPPIEGGFQGAPEERKAEVVNLETA
jgi:hypothetical protein